MASSAPGINSKLLNMTGKDLNNLYLACTYCFNSHLMPPSMYTCESQMWPPSATWVAFLALTYWPSQYSCHCPYLRPFHPLNLRLWYQKSFLITQFWVRKLNCAFPFSFHSFNLNKVNNTFHQIVCIPWYHFLKKCIFMNTASYPLNLNDIWKDVYLKWWSLDVNDIPISPAINVGNRFLMTKYIVWKCWELITIQHTRTSNLTPQ